VPYYLATVIVAAPFLAVIVGGLRRFLLGALIIDIALNWDITLYPQGDSGAPTGLNLSVTSIAICGLYALWLSESLLRSASTPRAELRACLIPLVFIILASVSIAVAHDKLLALFGLILLVQEFLVFLYLASTVRGWVDFQYITITLAVAVFIESLLILASYRLGHDFNFAGLVGHAYGTADSTGELYRPGGTIGAPNVAGSFLGCALVPISMILKLPVSQPMKIFASMTLISGITALILTYSRGGWLSFVVAVVAVLVISTRRRLFGPGMPLALGASVIVLAVPFHDVLWQRLNEAGGAESRVPLMEMAWKMIEANPILGVGLNNYLVALPDVAGSEFSGDWLSVVHNQYLLVWAETGIATLFVFGVFVLLSIYRGWMASSTSDRRLAVTACGFTASMVGMLPNMAVERFVNRPQIGLLWMSAGVLTALWLSVARCETDRRRRGVLSGGGRVIGCDEKAIRVWGGASHGGRLGADAGCTARDVSRSHGRRSSE
jgi:O-antigen ligase